MDISAALYSSGEGYGYSNRPDKVQYYSNLEFDVDLYEGYTQSVPTVTANGTTYNGTKNTGTNSYHFVIPIKTSIDSIVVNNVKKNTYTVTVPSSATGLSISGGGKKYITHGDPVSFSVEKKTGYTQQTPKVYYKIGNSSNWVSIGGAESGNKYTYTYNGVTDDMSFRIDNQSVNKYNIIYKLGEGVSEGESPTSINHFAKATVTLTVDAAHSQNEPAPIVNNGTLTRVSADKDKNIYTYELKDVTADTTVTVPALAKNTYTAVLPSGTGYTAKTEDDLGNIVYGTPISFGVDLDKQYDRSNVVVKYNGSVLQPTAGVYKIDNITSNITDGMITVEGVDLNNYYITLPLETETGFTIEVGKDADGNLLNAKSVLSGTDFNFKFFLDPAYSNSNPVIKYSADGGDHYKVLTEKDGKYTIENVLSDCIVVVEGVKKNTYTVNFTEEDGTTIIKQYKDVEYGAEVVFDGTEPTKASEKLSEYVEDGNTVVVTKEYKFAGWSADTSYVTSNMTVTPIFEVSEVKTTKPADGGADIVIVTPKTANILFVSGGVIVHKETVTKGEGFSGWDGTPVKTSSNPYETYTFTGWDTDRDGVVDFAAGDSNAIADVQNDVTFTAVFESNLPSQTVSYYNFNGKELLYSASVKRGEKAEYGLSGIPSRTDNTNTYEFAGWAFEEDADESKVVDSFIVGENDVKFYAAYSRKPIVYSYKFVNDGVTLQEGTFFNGDYYRYLGSTPIRASSVSTDYTFDDWKIVQSGYDTIYTALYSESVREYDSNLPTPDSTYTITDNATIPYGKTFTFTVTLAEGYEETEPNVTTASGDTLTWVSNDGNSYTYEIKLDGATAEEVYNDLTVTVGTTINNYDVAISGDAGCEVDPLAFNSAHGGEGSFIVTLKEGYTQTAPVVTVGEGNKVVVTLDKSEGNVYTYKVSEIKSDAKITVATKINEYKVVMVNWDGKEVFSGMVEHGKAPVYETPTKPSDENGKYDFIGWDTNGDGAVDAAKIENVTAPVTAKAVYNYNHRHDSDPADPDSVWKLDESKTTKKATCTEPGMKYYICRHCGEVTKEVVIPARGHNLTEWHVDKAPTCTETGLKSRYCQNTKATEDYEACAYAETNVVIPATGHHDSDEDYVCDDCGLDLGHCSKCICHKGNILSKVLRYICTLLTKTFHKPIKCCKDMDWYGDKISSIT